MSIINSVAEAKTKLTGAKSKVTGDHEKQYINRLLKRLSFLGYQSFHLKSIIRESIGVDSLKDASPAQYPEFIKSLEEYEYRGSIFMEIYSK